MKGKHGLGQHCGCYWVELISGVKKANPGFLFIAEAYWDLEWELQQQGFEFCYDKRLYDRLEHENAESVRLHLCADLAYQQRLLRFLENHDEPRAASAFFPNKEMAAAVTTSTLPGARLFHEGQFEGRKLRLPVFLGRRPEEAVDEQLLEFYRKLLAAIDSSAFREGQWSLCERNGRSDNSSFQNVVAWQWRRESEQYLIVVNLSASAAQAHVKLTNDELRGQRWELFDVIAGTTYVRDGDELISPGLYIDLQPWCFHFLKFRLAVK